MGNTPGPHRLVAVQNNLPTPGKLWDKWNMNDFSPIQASGRTWLFGTKGTGIGFPSFDGTENTVLYVDLDGVRGPVQFYLKDEHIMTPPNVQVQVEGENPTETWMLIIDGDMQKPRFSLRTQSQPDFFDKPKVLGILNSCASKFSVKMISNDPHWDDSIEPYHYLDLSVAPSDKITRPGHLPAFILEGDVKDAWNGNRIEIASGDYTFAIFRMGYQICCAWKSPWASSSGLLEGGVSQCDRRFKFLEIFQNGDKPGIRMVDQPCDFTPMLECGHTHGPNVNLVIKSSTELIKNYKLENGKAVPYDSFVSRIRLTDRNMKPFVNMRLGINSSCESKMMLTDGKLIKLPLAESKHAYPVYTDENGVIVVTQPVTDNIGASTLGLFFDDARVSWMMFGVGVWPATQIARRLGKLKTKDDWFAEKNCSNQLVFNTEASKKGVTEHKAPQNMVDYALFSNPDLTFYPIPREDPNAHHLNSSSGDSSSGVASSDSKLLRVHTSHHSHPDHSGLDRPSPAVASTMCEPNGSVIFSFDFSSKMDAVCDVFDAEAHEDKRQFEALKSKLEANSGQSPLDKAIEFINGLIASGWKLINKIEAKMNEFGKIILELGDAILEVESVWELWACLGGAFKKMFDFAQNTVVEWLGELLDWTEIKSNFNVLKTALIAAPAQMKFATSTATAQLRSLLNLDKLKKGVEEMPAWQKNVVNEQDSKQSNQPKLARSLTPYTSSPSYNWAVDLAINDGAGTSLEPPDLSASWSTLTGLFEGQLDALKKALNGHNVNQKQSFMEMMKSILDLIGSTVVSLASSMLDKFDELMKAAFDCLFKMLDMPLELPLLGALWREFIRDAGKTDSPTVRDMFCLMIAIPMTYLIKVFKFVLNLIPHNDPKLLMASADPPAKVWKTFILAEAGAVMETSGLVFGVLGKRITGVKWPSVGVFFCNTLSTTFTLASIINAEANQITNPVYLGTLGQLPLRLGDALAIPPKIKIDPVEKLKPWIFSILETVCGILTMGLMVKANDLPETVGGWAMIAMLATCSVSQTLAFPEQLIPDTDPDKAFLIACRYGLFALSNIANHTANIADLIYVISH
jgi:hypothetical protein